MVKKKEGMKNGSQPDQSQELPDLYYSQPFGS